MTSEPLTPEALHTIEAEEPLRIWWNKNLRHKISPAKLAAHAAHAALHAYGIEYTHPIVVLGAGKAKIEAMPITIHDAGLTELEPGTLTTGVESPRESPELSRLRTENEEVKRHNAMLSREHEEALTIASVAIQERDAANERSGWAHDKLTERTVEHETALSRIAAASSALSEGPTVADSYRAVRAALTGEATDV